MQDRWSWEWEQMRRGVVTQKVIFDLKRDILEMGLSNGRFDSLEEHLQNENTSAVVEQVLE